MSVFQAEMYEHVVVVLSRRGHGSEFESGRILRYFRSR